MRQTRLAEIERRLAEEKRVKYQGSARIRIEDLHFPLGQSREADDHTVARLRTLFAGENGCRDRDPRNHVVALIEKQYLDLAIADANISPDQLLPPDGFDFPRLDLPPAGRLICLLGRQRVLAAAEYLPPGDKRWTVDLYLAGWTLCHPIGVKADIEGQT